MRLWPIVVTGVALYGGYHIVKAIAEPKIHRAAILRRETAAIDSIHAIGAAELKHKSKFGRYAISLMELGQPNAMIPEDLASGEKDGYRFRLEERGDFIGPVELHKWNPSVGYRIQANPAVYGEGGTRTFYSDETGVIHQNKGSEMATENSEATR